MEKDIHRIAIALERIQKDINFIANKLNTSEENNLENLRCEMLDWFRDNRKEN